MKKISILTTLFSLILLMGNNALKGENLLKTNIKGHWNYPKNSVQDIEVISEGEDVVLFINGITFGHGRQVTDSLYRFDNVIFQPGELTAVSYDENGKEMSRHTLQTAGAPAQIKLTIDADPEGFRANGSDLAIIQFEIADFQGNRCGADDRMVVLELDGEAEWIGSDSQKSDNSGNERTIKAINGTNKAYLRSKRKPGEITVKAKTNGLAPVSVMLNSIPED